MFDVTMLLGNLFGFAGFVTAISALVYQRRQTQIMETGLEKAIEVKITREFEASEGETGTEIEGKLRAVISKRLSDNRARMRQEFYPRLDQIEAALRERHVMEYSSILTNLSNLLKDEEFIKQVAEEAKTVQQDVLTAQERILAESGRNTEDIGRQGREIEALEQQIEDMRNGIGYEDMARPYIRLIAEQLLRITTQERHVESEGTAPPTAGYPYGSATPDMESE